MKLPLEIGFIGRQTVNKPLDYQWNNRARTDGQNTILQYNVEGECVIEWDNKVWRSGPGDAFLFRVPEDSRYYGVPSDQPYRLYFINFHGDATDQVWDQWRQAFGPVLHLGTESEAVWLIRQMHQLWHNQASGDPLEWSLRGYQLIMAIWRQLEQSRAEGDPVEAAWRRIEEHFRIPFNIKGLAADLGITREHLTRRYRDRHGISPARHLRQRRHQWAEHLARTTSYSKEEISRRSGLGSARNWTRQSTS